MGYHYGETIREYRMLAGMTLAQLGEKWPSKETGVTPRYVSDIERGIKHVQDISVLRELAAVLHIPLWKFGLSEHNPFQTMHDNLAQVTNIRENFDLLDSFIQQIWVTKVTSGIDVDKHILSVSNHLDEMINKYPPYLFDNADFLRIYAQIKRLQAVRAYDHKCYEQSLQQFFEMLEIAERDNNPVTLALSNMGIGVELMRSQRLEQAEKFLQRSKDATFNTSKELASLVYGMLARYYAIIGDSYQFEKYYNYAANFGVNLGNDRLNTKDYVFTSFSGVMEEGSNGFILLGNGREALDLLPGIESQISKENNIYLDMWIPLDYAQAFLCLDQVEESLHYLKLYVDKTRLMRTAHIFSRIGNHLQEIEAKGYGDLQVVREFREMIRED